MATKKVEQSGIISAAMYLRKSRAEEGMSNEDTLNKHRAALTAYAAKYHYQVLEDDIYQEVVSGESLYARPEMLRLLEAVDAGKYQAVLCMDLQRLGRGGMSDQGIILDTFKYSGTAIVTPERTYDLSQELDEEAAEFGTFISRREYKLITKRLRRGLNQTIAAGGYVANAPFGYNKCLVRKVPSLEIDPDEAEIVRLIFKLYADGVGCTRIEERINAMGIRGRRGSRFSRTTINLILHNPVYIGKIRWNRTNHIKSGAGQNRRVKIVYNPSSQWKLIDGLQEPIISQKLWDAVQARFAGRTFDMVDRSRISNPLAGLVKCANCGRNLQKMNQNKGVPYLLCTTKDCCAGARYEYVEQAVLCQLRTILTTLELRAKAQTGPDVSSLEAALKQAENKQQQFAMRRERLYQFLEDGTYDQMVFTNRMDKLTEETAELDAQIATLQNEIARQLSADRQQQINQLRTVLDLYGQSDVSTQKTLIRSIISEIIYTKSKKTKPSDFQISIKLKDF